MFRKIGMLAAALLASAVLLAAAPGAAAADPGGFLYTARQGDTLWQLSQRFGTSLWALRQANNIWDDTLYPGTVLWVPTDGGAGPGAGYSRAVTSDDLYLLARMIHAEARGEPYAGQVAVGAVILNRVYSGIFPDTIAGVIFQPWQFEPVMNGQFWLEPSATAIRAAKDALAGWDPTGGALYFFNPAKSRSSFLWSRPLLAVIGNHYFFG